MLRWLIIFATLGLGSCAGHAPFFLGHSVGMPLPEPGTEQELAELVPASVKIVCQFGPYTDALPESVPEIYRKTIEEIEIFPIPEHQGYFVYMRSDGSLVGSDKIRYRVNGYTIGYGRGYGQTHCRKIDAVKVGVRITNGSNHIYLAVD